MIVVDPDTIRQIIREEIRAVIQPEPEWLPVPEAAQKLGVSEGTVRRWVREGRAEVKGFGKARRVRIG